VPRPPPPSRTRPRSWDEWASVDRTKLGAEAVAADGDTSGRLDAALAEGKAEEEASVVDTTIVGPWMGRWDIVNHNRHTAKFAADAKDTSWH